MTARDAALIELDARSLLGWKPRSLKRSQQKFAAPPMDPRDRALLENIVTGVIKNLLLLQHLTQHYSGRRLEQIDDAVQKIIAIALYQLRFLTRIPDSAAVDEAVEQTRRFGLKRAGGFVNAVLRNATRDPDPPLPSADADPRGYANIALSHPPELFDRLVSLAGVDEALRICHHNQSQPPTIVRLFPGVTIEQLHTDDVVLSPHQHNECVVVSGVKQHHLAAWADAGLAQAQDPTSASVVPALEVQPGHRVLDRCCGRGTKTLQLHAACGPGESVVAIDPSEARIASLNELIIRRNIENISIVRASFLHELDPSLRSDFDRILVDAPCSNSGVLARRPEARYRQNRSSLASVGELQRQILDDCASALVPGGLIAYSTCSIWPEENQDIVAWLLDRHPQFRKRHESVVLPGSDEIPAHYHDGGYVAVLEYAV